MPGCQIVDVDHVQSGVDERRDSAIEEIENKLSGWRWTPVAGAERKRREDEGNRYPLRRCSQNLVLGHVLGPLIQSEQMGHIGVIRFVCSLTSGGTIKSEHSDGARVDHALTRTPAGRLEHIEHAADVDVVEVLGSPRPEPVQSGQMEDKASTSTSGNDCVGIAHVERDSLNVESVKVSFVSLWFNECDHMGTPIEQGTHHRRTDESRRSRDDRAIARCDT